MKINIKIEMLIIIVTVIFLASCTSRLLVKENVDFKKNSIRGTVNFAGIIMPKETNWQIGRTLYRYRRNLTELAVLLGMNDFFKSKIGNNISYNSFSLKSRINFAKAREKRSHYGGGVSLINGILITNTPSESEETPLPIVPIAMEYLNKELNSDYYLLFDVTPSYNVYLDKFSVSINSLLINRAGKIVFSKFHSGYYQPVYHSDISIRKNFDKLLFGATKKAMLEAVKDLAFIADMPKPNGATYKDFINQFKENIREYNRGDRKFNLIKQ